MAYTVKAVADMAGVSIRTPHHYDDIGLLKPAQVSPSGYRMYEELKVRHDKAAAHRMGRGPPEERGWPCPEQHAGPSSRWR